MYASWLAAPHCQEFYQEYLNDHKRERFLELAQTQKVPAYKVEKYLKDETKVLPACST